MKTASQVQWQRPSCSNLCSTSRSAGILGRTFQKHPFITSWYPSVTPRTLRKARKRRTWHWWSMTRTLTRSLRVCRPGQVHHEVRGQYDSWLDLTSTVAVRTEVARNGPCEADRLANRDT